MHMHLFSAPQIEDLFHDAHLFFVVFISFHFFPVHTFFACHHTTILSGPCFFVLSMLSYPFLPMIHPYKGTFGTTMGLSDPSCSGLCSPGYWCPSGSTNSNQNLCPGGIYGAESGLISAQCSPVCEPGGSPNSTSSVADKYCVPRFCEQGSFSFLMHPILWVPE